MSWNLLSIMNKTNKFFNRSNNRNHTYMLIWSLPSTLTSKCLSILNKTNHAIAFDFNNFF